MAIVSRHVSFDYVLAQICSQHDVVLIVRPGPGPLRWDLFRKSPVRVAWKKLLGASTRRAKRKAHTAVAGYFPGNTGPGRDIPQLEIPAPEINSRRVEAQIRQARPEVLFVFGSPVLKENIFSQASLCAINLHMGIAPRYRGMNTLFWALSERDPQGLGFTLHRIDRGIDTGPVLAYGWPALEGGETETELWLRCLELAGRVTGEVIANPGAGKPVAEGTLYPVVRRTLLAEATYRLGRWRPPARAEQVRLFGSTNAVPGSCADAHSRGAMPNGQ